MMSGDVVSEGTYYDHHTDTGGHTTSGGRVFGVTPFLYADCERYGCQPRVVIDPESREQVARLMADYFDHMPHMPLDAPIRETGVGYMQDALRSLLEPPRPDEPTGLGAIAQGDDDDLWVRDAAGNWLNLDGGSSYISWDNLRAVRVLSDGVTA